MANHSQAKADAGELLRSVLIQATQISEVAEFRDWFAWDLGQNTQKVHDRWKAQAIREYQQLPDDAPEPDPEQIVREINRRTFAQLKLTLNMANSSSLVLVHSLVDALVNDLLRVTAIVARQFWEQKCQEKAVKLKDVQSAEDRDSIADQVIQRAIEDATFRLSLADRVELIHTICTPKESGCPSEGFSINCLGQYAYERERLQAIDRARQKIIHHKGVTDELPNIQEQIAYLDLMLQNLCILVARSYELKPDVCCRDLESRMVPFRLTATFTLNAEGEMASFNIGE